MEYSVCTTATMPIHFLFPAIGSGGSYALAAARALIDIPAFDAKTIGI